jgi:hypothetical protein
MRENTRGYRRKTVNLHVELVSDVATGMDKEEGGTCAYCKGLPCVWVSNKEGMLQFDDSEHGGLSGNDLPLPNKSRKGIYRQMALIINGGPTGKGVGLELPICIVNGVRKMFPESNKKCMGHMEN